MGRLHCLIWQGGVPRPAEDESCTALLQAWSCQVHVCCIHQTACEGHCAAKRHVLESLQSPGNTGRLLL